MPTAAAQGSFRFHSSDRRAVEAGLISVDDAGLRMRWIAERLAEQALGRRGIAQRREQEVDSGTRGIDGPVEVTPSALHSNICLIDPPGFVGRLELTAQPLFQFGTVTLHPTPDRRVIRLQTALGEQFFDIAQRQRVAEIPAHRAKNQLWRRLPPLEDCRSGCVLHGLFRLPASPAKVATYPFKHTEGSTPDEMANVILNGNCRLGKLEKSGHSVGTPGDRPVVRIAVSP